MPVPVCPAVVCGTGSAALFPEAAACGARPDGLLRGIRYSATLTMLCLTTVP